MNPKPLVVSDYQNLKTFFDPQPHDLCTYSLPSVIVWSTHLFWPNYVTDGSSLVISYEYASKFADKRHMILPLSLDREFTPEKLFNIAGELGFSQFKSIPEEYIDKHGREQIEKFFKIEEQTRMEDYVYLTEDLADLKGNRYSKKRNLINQFIKEYVNKNRIETRLITRTDSAECIDFLEKWCIERDCDSDPDEDLACEKQAAINSLENIESIGMKGLLIKIDGKISAFGIGSRINDNMGALHFEKAFPNIKGLYQFLDRECARTLFSEFKYINKESDMGMPGLAKAKQSYYPVMMVKSFGLKIRQDITI
ncbi:phosphatidylglycerol lysyltransferase domain-containing protein [Desulfobacterales bacterium HSG16]|nr:phosphatidylglycerol lysyltransferase domain-containing protein [Desulfobacterales bacterium HSG16]